jgi:hypothetical protein
VRRTIDPEARLDAADVLERFVAQDVGEWQFDDLTSAASRDALVDEVRREAILIREHFPPARPELYCSEAGLARILELATRLRASVASSGEAGSSG